jgi:hypothetical protein
MKNYTYEIGIHHIDYVRVWFVACTPVEKPDDWAEVMYLHADGKIYSHCGPDGFFVSKSIAQLALAAFKGGVETEYLEKELFEI